jgi:putative endonuclease
MNYFVYILKSSTNSRYYIGYPSNISQRVSQYNSGKNKSTKHGIPWKLVYSETFGDKKSAWLRERQLKSYKGGEAFKKLVVS